MRVTALREKGRNVTCVDTESRDGAVPSTGPYHFESWSPTVFWLSKDDA